MGGLFSGEHWKRRGTCSIQSAGGRNKAAEKLPSSPLTRSFLSLSPVGCIYYKESVIHILAKLQSYAKIPDGKQT